MFLCFSCFSTRISANRRSRSSLEDTSSLTRTWFQATSIPSSSSNALKTVLKAPRPSSWSDCGQMSNFSSQHSCPCILVQLRATALTLLKRPLGSVSCTTNSGPSSSGGSSCPVSATSCKAALPPASTAIPEPPLSTVAPWPHRWSRFQATGCLSRVVYKGFQVRLSACLPSCRGRASPQDAFVQRLPAEVCPSHACRPCQAGLLTLTNCTTRHRAACRDKVKPLWSLLWPVHLSEETGTQAPRRAYTLAVLGKKVKFRRLAASSHVRLRKVSMEVQVHKKQS